MTNTQTLRIIAGQWRGRKIHFPAIQQIRPTPDRVRETLFNWLMPVVEGARCLDLFAGSGALGLEALSRGASEVVFCDSNKKITRYLKETIEMLGSDNAQVVNQDALQFLQACDSAFDIVFLDPPYDADVLLTCCERLEQKQLLKTDARVYLEHRGDLAMQQLPKNWRITREKQAGQVCYQLAQRD
jgi:16S rRNA (guanine966-N2)-methyltransferase